MLSNPMHAGGHQYRCFYFAEMNLSVAHPHLQHAWKLSGVAEGHTSNHKADSVKSMIHALQIVSQRQVDISTRAYLDQGSAAFLKELSKYASIHSFLVAS